MAMSIKSGLKAWLFPQEERFFQLFDRHIHLVKEASTVLKLMVTDFRNLSEYREQIKVIENKGDEIVKEVYLLANSNFITPFDHEDITGIIQALDDILDYIYAVANRVHLYEIPKATEEMREFAGIIDESVDILLGAVGQLQRITTAGSEKQYDGVQALEKKADGLLNEGVGKLLKGKDLAAIMKYKEIYENLEIVTDQCFALSCLILDTAVKYA